MLTGVCAKDKVIVILMRELEGLDAFPFVDDNRQTIEFVSTRDDGKKFESERFGFLNRIDNYVGEFVIVTATIRDDEVSHWFLRLSFRC